MKNIIIVGPSRAGKTTLARKISEELNYFVISLDKLVATFQGAYPQLDIRLNWNREKTTDNLAPFLGHFLGAFSSSHGVAYELNLRAHDVKGNRFVLEGGYFNFEKISSILKMYEIEELKDNFLLIGLVQNKKTADEFVNDFKKYDTEDDWTYGFDDDALREYVSQDAIPFNRFITDYLKKYGFTIYDTSTEREQVFNQIIEDIKSKLV
ncbi:MAG: AAA family ATPase [Saccharofermentanales bacterium]